MHVNSAAKQNQNRFYKEQSAGVRFSREACKPHTAFVRDSLALLFHPRPRPFV